MNPEIIASTHVVEPHAFVFPIFMLALLFAQKYFVNLNNKYLFLYAIFCGFSIGTQVTSSYIVLPFFIFNFNL